MLLSGKWSDLVAFNYAVEPNVLKPYVPAGTELDFFEGRTYLSVIALRFQQPWLFGAIPLWHPPAPMVTFRIYVKRRRPDGSELHGTVFIKEFTPVRSIKYFARVLGKRDIQRVPVTAQLDPRRSYQYGWGRPAENRLAAGVEGEPSDVAENTLEDFLLEKRWDFVPFTFESTLEYQVLRPRWKVWRTQNAEARIDMSDLLSTDLARTLRKDPASVLVSEGSHIRIRFPRLGAR